MKKRLGIFLSIFILSVPLVFGQKTDEPYGKNRIQYKTFEWFYYSSENFDVYYYKGGQTFAKDAVNFLEEEFDRITDMMGYPPYTKTKVFLYNSQTDLEQSNVGLDYTGSSVGGEREFVKSYIEIAHPGNSYDFKEELLSRVSSLLIDEMMFGGSLKDLLQSTFMNLPEWFTSGAARYIAKGWSGEMDDYTRDYLRNNGMPKLNKLSGEQAAIIGHSIWNFIGEKYGKSNISSILNYIRIVRNEEKSIAITLGISLNSLLKSWMNFYMDMDQKLDQNYGLLSTENIVSKDNKRNKIYNESHLNSDGTLLVYSIIDKGRYSIILLNLESGEEKVVASGGYKNKIDAYN
ncbi:MAG: translocation protein TolB, partial [Cyclobacteriaceae bacterium]|nr:translocation protein TolB [Cyclobacteriaceae bacterium]